MRYKTSTSLFLFIHELTLCKEGLRTSPCFAPSNKSCSKVLYLINAVIRGKISCPKVSLSSVFHCITLKSCIFLPEKLLRTSRMKEKITQDASANLLLFSFGDDC